MMEQKSVEEEWESRAKSQYLFSSALHRSIATCDMYGHVHFHCCNRLQSIVQPAKGDHGMHAEQKPASDDHDGTYFGPRTSYIRADGDAGERHGVGE